jgi:hypothetical protein
MPAFNVPPPSVAVIADDQMGSYVQEPTWHPLSCNIGCHTRPRRCQEKEDQVAVGLVTQWPELAI